MTRMAFPGNYPRRILHDAHRRSGAGQGVAVEAMLSTIIDGCESRWQLPSGGLWFLRQVETRPQDRRSHRNRSHDPQHLSEAASFFSAATTVASWNGRRKMPAAAPR
ncbi:hypothetical protein MTBSS4_450006 [Magnetospirillum sp. SS-4]|nr:hypothetical protein MTBSS4_450006 [Magnetospirillum sp. SS-4]